MSIQDINDITSFKWATVRGVNPISIKLDGDTSPLALIPDSLVDPSSLSVGDRVRVELSMRKVVIHGANNGGSFRGTTAQRNARFGVPSTDPERVALANRRVIWFNTDTGWEESYYATTGKVGLLVPGLVSTASSDWYPTGLGPSISLHPTAQFSGPAGNPVRGWGTLGTNRSRRTGGPTWLTYDDSTGRVTMMRAGLYRVFVKSVITNGSGSVSCGLLIGPPAAPINTMDTYFTLSSTLFVSLQAGHETWAAQAGDVAYIQQFNGTVAWHMRANTPTTNIGGQFFVQYVGPPLVTD